MGKVYVCEKGCRLNRGDLKRINPKTSRLGCPMHRLPIKHVEVPCHAACGHVMKVDSMAVAKNVQFCDICIDIRRKMQMSQYNNDNKEKITAQKIASQKMRKQLEKDRAAAKKKRDGARPKGEPLQRSECTHYLECLGSIDYRKHNAVMHCWPCDRYEERVDDAADYMGTGSDRPDVLAPVNARVYSTGKR